MRLINTFTWLFFLLWMTSVQGQETFPINGVADEQDGHYALTNARIYQQGGKYIESGTLIVKKGKIIAVGKNITLPKEAVVVDMQGKYIYPSFIDLSSSYGLPKPQAVGKASRQQPQMLSHKKGAYAWNEAIRSEYRAVEHFEEDAKLAKAYRAQGFGLVLSEQKDGIARGSSALVFLGEDRAHELTLRADAARHYSFSKGTSTQSYPSSRMGAIALLRQSYYDAAWYAQETEDRELNLSLEAWQKGAKLPQIFETGNRFDVLRADKIGDEFGVQYILHSGGDDYMRLEEIKQTGAALIVPVNFPKAYDVSDAYDAEELSLADMKHWELAPTNAVRLEKAGVRFAFTMNRLKKKSDFWKNIRKAYSAGLSEAAVLKALTQTPAELLGLYEEIGSLEKGKYANFIVCSSNILEEKAVIWQNWVKGKAYSNKEMPSIDIRGTYSLSFGKKKYELEVKGTVDQPQIHLKKKGKKRRKKKEASSKKLNYALDNNILRLEFPASEEKGAEVHRLTLQVYAKEWKGDYVLANGDRGNCSAKLEKGFEAKVNLPKRDSSVLSKVTYPFLAYGYEQAPVAETVLFRNATVWTGEEEGRLEGYDVLVQGGKIAALGKDLDLPKGAKLIDATGKHLTAGIIDEHSHIGIHYGVNEGTQSSSAEVRIGDVVNSDDMNFYRQLAGGVTMAQQLHGSANPIGGQSSIIKFRWGMAPEQMKFEGADGFIKFALGENVKQSNWGDNNRTRFPQTRMGVEQVYEDYFTRALEYEKARAEKGDKVRRDLELDAIVEILRKKRFISCHSYVQSEITMLMRVAERYNFTLNTFTHILEGYKVADKMKQHGAGASTFSDWWAYKAEVLDAIPYNAKILDAMGIVTALNSDDAEMGRRMNQEAAKGVKYGGMSEEAAWKMVTINPAKLLHIDDKVGSIKKGKDADIVLWSTNPLSIYAVAQQTYVDGVCYYDIEADKAKRKAIAQERSRLVQKLLRVKGEGVETQKPVHTHQHHYHCGDLENNNYHNYND